MLDENKSALSVATHYFVDGGLQQKRGSLARNSFINDFAPWCLGSVCSIADCNLLLDKLIFHGHWASRDGFKP